MGWLTNGGMGFSASQFACAAVTLLDAKHHTIIYKDLMLLITARGINGTEDDAELPALESMVKANALSIRPYSDWALDIPLEAFQGQNTPKAFQSNVQAAPPLSSPLSSAAPPLSSDKTYIIVTASSALDLYCMGLLRQDFDEELESLGQQQVGI